MTPKEVKFVLGQIDCTTTYKIVSRYIEGLEEILAENAKTINQHEELLDLQQSEIEYFKDEVEHLTRLEQASDRVKVDYESDIEKLEVVIDELRSQIEYLETEFPLFGNGDESTML